MGAGKSGADVEARQARYPARTGRGGRFKFMVSLTFSVIDGAFEIYLSSRLVSVVAAGMR